MQLIRSAWHAAKDRRLRLIRSGLFKNVRSGVAIAGSVNVGADSFWWCRKRRGFGGRSAVANRMRKTPQGASRAAPGAADIQMASLEVNYA